MTAPAPAPMPLHTLLAGLAPLPVAGERSISGLTNDSRRVQPGDLFLALRGRRHHGLEFLPAVRAAGAAAVAWEPPYEGAIEADDGLALLAVEALSRKQGLIADRFYGEPGRQLRLIGITGTDGKTSCAHFIAQALDGCGLVGTLGYGVYGQLTAGDHTTPDALALRRCLAALRDRGLDTVALEVSSHALDQDRVAGLPFRVAVLTHLSRDHLDYHGDVRAYAAAKARLFLEHKPGWAVLNLDDDFGRRLAGACEAPVLGYGLGARPADGLAGFVWGEALQLLPTGLHLRVISSRGEGVLQAGLLGRFNAGNLLACLAALLALEVPFASALQRLSQVATAPGRMERLGGAGRPLAVVDYAHTPNALEQVLTALRAHTRGRLWCVFGCGGERDPGKRPLMGACAERLADQVVVTDDNPRGEDPQAIIDAILAGMRHPERVRVERNRHRAIGWALCRAAPQDSVLIAGKGHEDYQILGTTRIPFSDRQAVRHWLEVAA